MSRGRRDLSRRLADEHRAGRSLDCPVWLVHLWFGKDRKEHGTLLYGSGAMSAADEQEATESDVTGGSRRSVPHGCISWM